jgi:acyl-CoA reductase-like NAD-dependent aldehyde dehydrogenase
MQSPYLEILPSANYIGGQWLSSGEGVTEVCDKFTQLPLGQLPLASAQQADAAIAAAVTALPEMRSWSAAKRSQALKRLADLLEGKRAAFVDLIVREAGKPIGYARNEVERGVMTLRLAAAETLRFGGEYVPLDFGAGEGKMAVTHRFPVGVVLGITPFNFPLNLVLHKVAPALATGCPILLKPAPQAPLTALALAALVAEAGYPAGALQAFTCSNAVAETLVTDPRIAMLSFTGSDKVGWHLKSICGKKKVALELGGNAAVIVDETADLERAARLVATGAYIYAGQVCISTQRIYVTQPVFDAFREFLLAEIEGIQTGDPQLESTLVGPIIDGGHLQRIAEWVREALEAGAERLAGGYVFDPVHHLYAPTLLTRTRADMKVCTEEVFGPVAILESVPDFQAALQAVNESRFGLQAGVFTNRFDHVKMAHSTLEVGGVIINQVPGFRVDSMPYGGIKDSGLGREGIRYAMEDMTEPRLLVW